MLASSFMTAKQLGITKNEVEGLILLLHKLEAGEIVGYNSSLLSHENALYLTQFFEESHKGCGTMGCIAGWAHMLTEGRAFPELAVVKADPNYAFPDSVSGRIFVDRLPEKIKLLFFIDRDDHGWNTRWPTTEQLATAVRNYLTTGDMNG